MNDPMQRAPDRQARGAKNSAVAADTENDSGQLALDTSTLTGAQRRENGQTAALHASDVRAISAAERALQKLAASGAPFTAEDLRALVGAPLGARPNAMGGLFSRARKAGTIVPVGYTTATRPEAAGRVIRVWQGTGRGGAS